MMEMKVEKGDVVTVTDPCYDYGTWCTKDVFDIREGRYIATSSVGRPEKFKIVHEDFVDKGLDKECIGGVGVDSGLIGFFIRKPDFKTTREWRDFLDENDVLGGERAAFECNCGVFSETYFGDGMYKAYVLWYGDEKVGLMVDFKEGE